MSGDQTINETPSLANVIRSAIEARICDLHVSLPARIVSYEAATQKAVVQPEIQREYVDGSFVNIPTIRDVPVVWPRGANSFLHMPLSAGDPVTLVFSERSLDEWKESGGDTRTANLRKHNYSDAFAYPGGAPFSKAFAANGEDVEIVHGNTKMRMTRTGKYEFKGTSDEILDLLIQTQAQVIKMADTLNKDTTNTIFGPMMLNSFSVYGTIKSAVESLKNKLTAMKK